MLLESADDMLSALKEGGDIPEEHLGGMIASLLGEIARAESVLEELQGFYYKNGRVRPFEALMEDLFGEVEVMLLAPNPSSEGEYQ